MADGSTGVAYIELLVNTAPTKGSCSVDPSSGMSTVDDFQITCSGWEDADGVNLYEFFSKSLLSTYHKTALDNILIVVVFAVQN